MNILTAEKVVKAYPKKGKNRPIRLEIDQFNIEQGSFTAILGPNGSGLASVLLHYLISMLPFTGLSYYWINKQEF